MTTTTTTLTSDIIGKLTTYRNDRYDYQRENSTAWASDHLVEHETLNALKVFASASTPKWNWDNAQADFGDLLERVSSADIWKPVAARYGTSIDRADLVVKESYKTRKLGQFRPYASALNDIVIWRNNDQHKRSAHWATRRAFFTLLHEIAHHIHYELFPRDVRGGGHGPLFKRVLAEIWRLELGDQLAELLIGQWKANGQRVADLLPAPARPKPEPRCESCGSVLAGNICLPCRDELRSKLVAADPQKLRIEKAVARAEQVLASEDENSEGRSLLERQAIGWLSSPGLWEIKSQTLCDNGECEVALEKTIPSGAKAVVKISWADEGEAVLASEEPPAVRTLYSEVAETHTAEKRAGTSRSQCYLCGRASTQKGYIKWVGPEGARRSVHSLCHRFPPKRDERGSVSVRRILVGFAVKATFGLVFWAVGLLAGWFSFSHTIARFASAVRWEVVALGGAVAFCCVLWGLAVKFGEGDV